MQFTSAFVAMLLSATALATAIPGPDFPEPLMLDNGESIVDANAVHNALLARGGMCSGSALCSNDQKLKNNLFDAVSRIAATTYVNGGAKSGVCAGHIGIFVQGKDHNKKACTASGLELQSAVDTLQSNGCQVCGHITRSDGCQIKVDYVSSC